MSACLADEMISVARPNKKSLRIDWCWMRLGEYVDNFDAQRVPVSRQERESRHGEYPYYGASGVIDNIDGYTHDGEFVLIGEDGANLLTRSKPIAFLTKGKVWVNNHAHVLKCKQGFPNSYLAYYINSIDLTPYVTGTAQPKLSQSMMNKILIPVAPPDQQKIIVSEIEKQFSRLDAAVTNLKRVKANLKRYKASVLKDAVEGRLVPTESELARREGRGGYETGEQLLQRSLETRRSQWKGKGKGKYKEPEAPDTSSLSDLPEGWTWGRLDSIASLKGGITVDSKRKDPLARNVPYLRVANVQRGYLDLSEIKLIAAPLADIEELRLLPGDILFNEGGDRDKLGRGWLWEGQLADCIHQNHVFRARLLLNEISPKLVSWWGNSFGKDYFSREGKQTTNLASINLTKLSAFPVPLPPAAEQVRITAEVDRRLSLIREVETQVDRNMKRVERLRQSVLLAAFSGR